MEPALEVLSQRLVDRPDMVATLVKPAIPPEASGSASSTGQEDYTSRRPGREDMAPQSGGAKVRPRSAEEIRGILSSLFTEQQGDNARRARALFGSDAAAASAAPGGRMVATPSGGYSYAPGQARSATSMSTPACSFRGAADGHRQRSAAAASATSLGRAPAAAPSKEPCWRLSDRLLAPLQPCMRRMPSAASWRLRRTYRGGAKRNFSLNTQSATVVCKAWRRRVETI